MRGFPDALVGAFWMLGSAFCYVASATILRGLGDTYSPFELTFIRSLIATAIILPIFLNQGAKITIIPPRFGMHLAVAGFSYMGILFWFTAASTMPVADFFALQFTTPLFTIAMAIFFARARRFSQLDCHNCRIRWSVDCTSTRNVGNIDRRNSRVTLLCGLRQRKYCHQIFIPNYVAHDYSVLR